MFLRVASVCSTVQHNICHQRIHISALSQLQIFSQLMQQSPELLSQLGITPETLRSEMSKLENMEKMKVLIMNVLLSMWCCSSIR